MCACDVQNKVFGVHYVRLEAKKLLLNKRANRK